MALSPWHAYSVGCTLNLAWLRRGDLKSGVSFHQPISHGLSLSLCVPLWRHLQTETGVG